VELLRVATVTIGNLDAALLESHIAFTSLLARCDDIQLTVPVNELTYRITPNIRGLTGLPVTFTPR
jgi:cytochrome P450